MFLVQVGQLSPVTRLKGLLKRGRALLIQMYIFVLMYTNGIGFIVGDTGWACSDEAFIDIESDPVSENGKIKLIKTETIKLFNIFEVGSKIVKGLKVFCLLKSQDKKYAFTGIIRGKAGNITIVDLTAKSEYLNEIIAKIKSIKP